MRSSRLVPLLLVVAACQPSPADCVDKGDIEACRKLCDTGKEEFLPLCYEERARKIEACVDKDADCAAACTEWTNAGPDDPGGKAYRAKLGSDAKVAKMDETCAAATP